MDWGFYNDEVYLERVTEGTSIFINCVWLGEKCGDGGPVSLGHSTST